jgi:AAA15 family ATPase/GTPase
MIRSLTIKDYRCFTSLTIEPLERVNLIAGRNNIGKTSLLEALWIHHGYFNPELGVKASRRRGITIERHELMWDLFREFDPARAIEISGQNDDGQDRSLSITFRERLTSSQPLHADVDTGEHGQLRETIGAYSRESSEHTGAEVLFTYTVGSQETVQARAFVEGNTLRYERLPGTKVPGGIFLSSMAPESGEVLARRLSDVAVAKEQEKIIDVLRIVEPNLRDLTLQYRGNTPVIYGDVGAQRLMPLALMGEGAMHLLRIALGAAAVKGGVLLIDEIENGLHYSVLEKVWHAVANLARQYHVQVFATTHSHECIQSAHDAFQEREAYDFRLHRLERAHGAIGSVAYDQQALDIALEEGWEVR